MLVMVLKDSRDAEALLRVNLRLSFQQAVNPGTKFEAVSILK